MMDGTPPTTPPADEHGVDASNPLEVLDVQGERRELEISDHVTDSLLESIQKYSLKGHDEAVGHAFNLLDIRGDGVLNREELVAFLSAAAAHIKLVVEPEVIDDAVDALIQDASGGKDGDGGNDFITRDQFKGIFSRHPEMLRVFQDEGSVHSLQESIRSRVSTPEEIEEEEEENEQVWKHVRTHWKNMRVAIIWLFLYLAANVAAFTAKAIRYANHDEAQAVFGNCITVARGSAAALNLNACFVLLPICRHFLTAVRSTKLRHLFPFDASLETHMLVGIMFALFSTAHFAAHMCDFARFASADEQDLYALFGDKLGVIPESRGARWGLLLQQRAGITGIIMVLCLIVAYALIPGRRKRFNQFWYGHHLLLIMLIALCIHGTGNLLEHYQSLYWIIAPLSLYFIPRLYREMNCNSAKVLDVKEKGGGVVALRLEKPSFWKEHVKAGHYAFLNVPKVSRFEWHPFTLTSCPADNYIEFHFRQVGDWTKSVRDILKDSAKAVPENDADDANFTSEACSYPSVRVEGPIGASSQGFRDFPVIVLVGAGIGITPMISVLKMLLSDPGKMRRTFFYWTVRDRDAFQWFSSVMDGIYESDQKSVLQVRHFLTSVRDDDRDLGAVLLHHATRARHKHTDIDLILGRRTHHQVEVGRPVWEEEFVSVREESKALGHKECGIFLCGPEKMAEAVQETAISLSKDDPEFHFFFAKETF